MSHLVSPLSFLFIVAAFLFVLVVTTGEQNLSLVLDIRHHEWFRELRRDYYTSRQQFWRDWRLFRRYARENRPWLLAGLSGAVCMLLGISLLILSLPAEARTSRTSLSQPQQMALLNPDSAAIDTRVGASPSDWQADAVSVVVSMPPAGMLAVREATPPPAIEPAPREPVDLNAAFSEFDELLQPVRESPAPGSDLIVTFDRVTEPADLSEEFEATSVVQADVADALLRLRPDDWTPAEVRLPVQPQPILYRERYGDVILSQHERSMDATDDASIRIRPRAVGRETSPAVSVRKTLPPHVQAGSELSYAIEVTNPGIEAIAGLVVEEHLPANWSVIDASPRGRLNDQNVLSWQLDRLEEAQSVRLQLRVLVGAGDVADTRTVVTTGAAVESFTRVPALLREDEPLPLPSPVTPDFNKWQASGNIETPARDLTGLSPRAEFAEAGSETPEPQLRVRVDVPERVQPGPVRIRFQVRNVGSVAVEDARLLLWLSEHVTHPRGRRLKHAVGPLASGEERTLEVLVQAVATGDAVGRVELRAGDAVFDRDQAVFVIEEPGADDVAPEPEPEPGAADSSLGPKPDPPPPATDQSPSSGTDPASWRQRSGR